MDELGLPAVWEHARSWALIRPFVYYQLENFVPEGVIEGRDVIDFSAGLGDLSAHVAALGPRSLVATAPEPHAPRPELLPAFARWQPGIGADAIADLLPQASADVILARMVIQFPTVEVDFVDVDETIEQMRGVLRPGGSLVISTHAYFSLPHFGPHLAEVEDHLAAVETEIAPLLDSANDFTRGVARETAGLIELVRYLGLPPREGPFGGTGFGLKIPMLVHSFVAHGFDLRGVEEIEPFTLPVGIRRRLTDQAEELLAIGEQVLSIKRRHLTSEEARDPYRRPTVLAGMLAEIRRLVPVTAVPIVRVWADRK